MSGLADLEEEIAIFSFILTQAIHFLSCLIFFNPCIMINFLRNNHETRTWRAIRLTLDACMA